VAPVVGRLADRISPRSIIAAASAGVLLSFVIFWLGGSSLTGIGLGVFALDVAMQSAQVTNMARIYRQADKAHSRINSAYMVFYFVGGAAGSFGGAYAWSLGRWAGVCAFGGILAAVALVAHLAVARGTQVASADVAGGARPTIEAV
jgi:predicted MFS family arabinose efflux permease